MISLDHVLDSCMLCPRRCGANRNAGEKGICGSAEDLIIARAALHFWEEPPLSGESGSGTIFFSHCPLHCIYCQNEQIAAGRHGKAVGVERLVQICFELAEQGALNVNLVTPTHYAVQIREALAQAKQAGLSLPIVYNTSGYELPETLQLLDGLIDIYLTDFKYWSADAAIRYSKAADYRACATAALAEMVKQVGTPCYEEKNGEQVMTSGVVVRHMLLPGYLEDAKRIVGFIHESYGSDVVLSLMSQYTPLQDFPEYPELAHTVDKAEYEALLDYADSLGIDSYFWQEGSAAETSFVPAFDNTGV